LWKFERILPGCYIPIPGGRAYINWGLPDFSKLDIVVLSTFTSWTGQMLMRGPLRGRRWVFWGERLNRDIGWKGFARRTLTAPMRRASAVVGIGRLAEDDYHRRFPHLPHFCIPYHCDLSSYLGIARSGSPRSPLTFLFCGQMIVRKGV